MKFRKPHHSKWNAFENQHTDGDEAAQAASKELKEKGNDTERGQAVCVFCLLNPAGAQCVKRKFFGLIIYAKQKFVTTEKKDNSNEQPTTQTDLSSTASGRMI